MVRKQLAGERLLRVVIRCVSALALHEIGSDEWGNGVGKLRKNRDIARRSGGEIERKLVDAEGSSNLQRYALHWGSL